jgi:uncharacterized integral membrane protein (TIGR00697 family)
MSNEVILSLALIINYSAVVLAYHYFGKEGLYCFTVLATIAANIEVLIIVRAFGMEQTLGNILFASTFLVTDILSEMYGRKAANKAVKLGIAGSAMFMIISQSWMLYTPDANDWVSGSIRTVFTNIPRMMIASIAVYAIVQAFDVFAYHFIWNKTTIWCHDSHRFLWLRNNGATLISQFLNTFLFTFAAFYGTYTIHTLMNIVWSSYVIFIATSLLDTPAVYIARRIGTRDQN